ncbi:uncharacterized protein LOC141595428 [Silene latifolia]|uniref:uncharacterized protein LOC141595428 n=1 Tax=Silene latifolia TaxID=37657 RepID=UPI003D782549
MGALKAPRPDGIPAVFYQRCWSMLKGEFTKAILSILNSGRVLRELNRTFITLIPKKDNPEGVTDYRPISLCNVMMRIVTKCIANRLTKVMSALVSETQNAFLPGRNISDNILVAHEAINKISSHGKGRQALGAFKADMSKAYDRVRWDFLEAVLVKYGFPPHLISLMMSCVTTVSYEILVNGVPLPQFKPRCGLRQGDPLSPYLFILCMEVLSRNVNHAHELRLVHGVQLVKEVRPTTHLFFADDSFFFFKDKGNTVTHLAQIIKEYCDASGQRLNVDKSGILFSPNTTLAKAQRIMKIFDIKKNNGIGKYLGIPAEFKDSKQGIFNALIEHVTIRISSWNGIFLSPAGRLTLISSVLSNLSNYFLSVFKVPVSVAKKINSILAQFWWTGCRMGHNIHWCSKNFLSLPKSAGGLGIRNVKCLNQALLAKHGWRIVSGESSLFCRIFRQKIFGTQVIQQGMAPIRGTGCSWGTRSILYGLTVIMENMGWKPGFDSKINIWTTRWVGGERPKPKADWLNLSNGHLANLQVQNLFQSDGKWNKVFIEGLFTEEWATWILALPRCEVRRDDKVFWPLTTTGIYRVKSGYGLIFTDYMDKAGTDKDNGRLSDRGRLFCRKELWKLPVPQMWKILLWKITTNVLPTGNEFTKRKIDADPFCGMCRGDQRIMETPEHLFRDCGLSGRIWAGSVLGIRVEGARGIPISNWICDWIHYLHKKEEGMYQVIHFVATLWGLWTMRNKIKFQDQAVNSHVITNMVYNVIGEKVHILCKSLDLRQTLSDLRSEEEGSSQREVIDIRNGHPVCVIGKPTGCTVVRVKVDASWNQTFEVAFGWNSYDGTGQELGRKQVRTRAESPLQAEALGVRDIVEWAREERILHLDISSDCLQLISQIAGVDKDNHRIVGLLEDLRDIIAVVKDFFTTGKWLKKVNTTTLTLIPKIDNPTSVLDFRPIACCNTVYKCISKVLCKRLSKIVPDIVNEIQGGFIKGRNIVENVLICKKTAYDSVEWVFLKQMLTALNFPVKFMDLIMQCVSSPMYTLALNGSSFGFFQGKRGLRGFTTFSAASGLSLNKSKSSIYFNGVPTPVVNEILQVSGFQRGTLPFKYLGVPISAKKLTKNEGMELTDRIVARIRGWGARHLSNAGKSEYHKPPSVSWDMCCIPKDEGGHGIKEAKSWNKALLGKYAWWLANKQDHLWVKWVNHVYMKDKDW